MLYVPGNLLVSGSRTASGVRRDFIKAVCSGLNRLRTVIQVDSAPGLDFDIYRTLREIPYALRFEGFSDATLEIWRGRLTVSNNALCFEHPQLQVDLHYLRNNTPYWRQLV